MPYMLIPPFDVCGVVVATLRCHRAFDGVAPTHLSSIETCHVARPEGVVALHGLVACMHSLVGIIVLQAYNLVVGTPSDSRGVGV